jgi:phosphatidylinositol 4-phosphatase
MADVTHTLQRVARIAQSPVERGKPLWKRADDRFFWNRDLIGELVAANAHDFITPVMNGHVDLRLNCSVNVHRFNLLFVSRRSRFRQGCR